MRALCPELDHPDGGEILAKTVGILARAPEERLVFNLHDKQGAYICAFERTGTRERLTLNFRDLIERALANGARGLLLIHNHPSGDPTPSADDIMATRMLAALCLPLEITLHDHLVVGRRALVSMRRAGHLSHTGNPVGK